MQIKPSDFWTISLCAEHHRLQTNKGEPWFERAFGLDMKAKAQEFWAKSPHRKKQPRPTKCVDCGINWGDPMVCPGCQAYREHTV